MKKSTKIGLITIGACIVLFIGGAGIYRMVRAQGTSETYTINQEEKTHPKVLILTQQSNFKDAVMDEVEKKFKGEDVFIQVQDISTVDKINQKEWDGIVLVTTVESNDLPEKAHEFVKKDADYEKVRLFVTSDSGQWSNNPSDVDVITTSSRTSNVASFSKKINEAIQAFEEDQA